MGLRLAIVTLVLTVLAGCHRDQPPHLQPSGFVVEAPDISVPFDDYLTDTRERLRNALALYYQDNETPFGRDYPLSTVLEMRSPFELAPASQCRVLSDEGKIQQGYLLLHGLSDSPYLLSAIARQLHEQDPCALVRAVLMPGHGTVPGDAREVNRDQWRQTVRYGIEQFRSRVEQLTLVGYSAGATLALEYVDQHPDDALIDGLVLLSPALALPGTLVKLSPYLRWFRQWLGVEAEQDAAKYESFPIHAGAEFFLMVREFNWRQMAPLRVPVFMAASSHDTTVDAQASLEFFCTLAPQGRRELFWLDTDPDESLGDTTPQALTAPADCEGIRRVVAVSERVVSASHVGITLPPDDPHYGLDGRYRQCLHYPAGELREGCLEQDEQTVYGERSLLTDGRYQGSLLRRSTFNPAFDEMMTAVHCLLDADCQRRPSRMESRLNLPGP